ncbi:MAG: hypothetical protein K9L17_04415 [Clostridiales bacterium]|nr:hypothetical protein [Clostridiales bacterium]MCF8021923.1 hypothetical protein [Clostridiales bacterium]
MSKAKIVSCPNCGSDNIKEYNKGYAAMLIGLFCFSIGLMLDNSIIYLLGVGLAGGGLLRKIIKTRKPADFICINCKHRWKQEK